MADLVAIVDGITKAYNAKDWASLEGALAPDFAFAHHNRGVSMNAPGDFMALLRKTAEEMLPDRHYKPADRIQQIGNIVVREGYWSADAAPDSPRSMKLCTVLRFSDDGLLAEWSDYG
jgi:hypothetical protein